MREESRNYVMVGGFVIAMIVALIVWIGLISGRTGASDDYFVVYENVLGLKSGVQILYEGYPVGLIEDIRPIERDGRQYYRLDVSVKKDWRIPADSVATISAPGLLASVVIDIRAGESAESLEPGSEITSKEASDVLSAMNSAAGVLSELLEDELKPLVANVGDAAPAILDNLETFTMELNGAMDQINQVLAPNNVQRISSILGNLDDTTEALTPLVQNLGETRSQLGAVMSRIEEILHEDQGEIGVALADLQRSLAAIARHIDAITANLETTTRNTAEFSKQIRDNPGVLVRGRETEKTP